MIAPQTRHLVKKARMGKGDLHLDKGVEGPGFRRLLPAHQAEEGKQRAAAVLPEPLRFPYPRAPWR